jgi:hypothetical protein
LSGWIFQIGSDKGKLPIYYLNGGVISEIYKILILIERKLGIRIIYLKFEE